MPRILLILLSLLSLTAHAFSPRLGNFVDGPQPFSDSNIRGPSYEQQIKSMQRIASARPDIAKVISYGKSVRCKTLTGLLISPANTPFTKLALVTGATHGNEYLNIADRLANALLNSQAKTLESYVAKGGAMLFIPILNPDGYERRQRSNAKWADLNRDWPSSKPGPKTFRQPESKALADWVEQYVSNNKGGTLNFAMDYHCCVDGMLLKPWGYQAGKYMPKSDEKTYAYFIDSMLNIFPKPGKVGTPPDLLYSAKGTTLDYWYDRYGAVSLTYEGTRTYEKNFLDKHVLWWEEILSNL